MRRGLSRALLAVLAAASLPGCAFSLFSEHESHADGKRVRELEGRMDEIERRLGPAPQPATLPAPPPPTQPAPPPAPPTAPPPR